MRFAGFWLTAALSHLFLVAWGASQLQFGPDNWGNRMLDAYGTLNGANLGYTYFAPEIASEFRARFVVTEPDGNQVSDTLPAGTTREAQLRIHNIVALIGERMEEDEGRRELVASWAGKMFARHPHAVRVDFILEDYDLPSLDAYGKGRRPVWRTLYTASFVRKNPSHAQKFTNH